ncbi:cbb3-type cytochrome oxidase assembly protein CcoS [Oceanobacter mangrovi]|uniref:cbb3-type cytochrome oxidase assembly protein CcoS n=1 Tax=Oceanobacter mangrovi TaxID=2862510 RepID=UPI001C8E189D|nr:cbb3-type cytochrome oxidase assembly protein CcoS [Oceanobacter mangrovi]
MDIIYVLVPLSILLIGIAVLILFWAVRSGQFDDMESPAHKILFDDDDDMVPGKRSQSTAANSETGSTRKDD